MRYIIYERPQSTQIQFYIIYERSQNYSNLTSRHIKPPKALEPIFKQLKTPKPLQTQNTIKTKHSPALHSNKLHRKKTKLFHLRFFFAIPINSNYFSWLLHRFLISFFVCPMFFIPSPLSQVQVHR